MRKKFLKITAIFLAFLSIFEFNFGKIIFAEEKSVTEVTIQPNGKVVLWQWDRCNKVNQKSKEEQGKYKKALITWDTDSVTHYIRNDLRTYNSNISSIYMPGYTNALRTLNDNADILSKDIDKNDDTFYTLGDDGLNAIDVNFTPDATNSYDGSKVNIWNFYPKVIQDKNGLALANQQLTAFIHHANDFYHGVTGSTLRLQDWGPGDWSGLVSDRSVLTIPALGRGWGGWDPATCIHGFNFEHDSSHNYDYIQCHRYATAKGHKAADDHLGYDFFFVHCNSTDFSIIDSLWNLETRPSSQQFKIWLGKPIEYGSITGEQTITQGQVMTVRGAEKNSDGIAGGIFIEANTKLTIEPGGLLSVSGNVFCNGTIENYGTIILQEGAHLLPYKEAGTTRRCVINNYGGGKKITLKATDKNGNKVTESGEGAFIMMPKSSMALWDSSVLSFANNAIFANHGLAIIPKGYTSINSTTVNYGDGEIDIGIKFISEDFLKNLASLDLLNQNKLDDTKGMNLGQLSYNFNTITYITLDKISSFCTGNGKTGTYRNDGKIQFSFGRSNINEQRTGINRGSDKYDNFYHLDYYYNEEDKVHELRIKNLY